MLSANQCKNLWNMARIISVMLASRYKLSYKPISIDRKLICQLLSAIGDLNPKLLPSSKLDGKHPGCLAWGCGPKSKRKRGIVLMSYVLYFVDTLRVRQTAFYRQHLFEGHFLNWIIWIQGLTLIFQSTLYIWQPYFTYYLTFEIFCWQNYDIYI